MQIVTITSDWNNDDYYLAALKGRILSKLPEIKIIELTNKINLYNSLQAAFIIKSSFFHFPENTIHLIAVNTESNENNPFVIVKAYNQYFIGVDNGIFFLMFGNEVEDSVKVNLSSNYPSFMILDIFPELIKRITFEKSLKNIGEKYDGFIKQTPIIPTIDENTINGLVVYIDSYKNIITNISKDVFEEQCKNRKFNILVKSNYYKIDKISKKYSDVPEGELVALFNSLNLLEIAINRGHLAELLSININSIIRIKFY